MTDDTKHKIGDKSAQPGDGAHKLDNPETKDLVNAGGTAMRGIESTRTNKSSGSFDESQEMSIEIDFGNGHRESRRNKGAGETGQPAETTMPSREQLKHETLGALIPLAQVADVEVKTSLEPPLPRPNGPVYVDRTVPSPLLHQSHAHEAASVESAALQAVVPRGADSGVVEGARDLPLSPKDQPIAGYSPESHDKNGFVKDPVGYGLMLAQQVKPGEVRTDVAPPPAPVPRINKPTQSQTPAPAPVPAPFSPSVKPVLIPAPVLPVTHKDTSVSPQFHPTLAPPPIDSVELARKTAKQSDASLKEELSARETLNQSKHTLEVNARAVITNKTECDQFLADMRDFEKGYVERTPLDRAKALVEIAETYKQVDRLLTATSDKILDPPNWKHSSGETPWRVQIAEQIMHHAADPSSISQGVLAVCTTTALQIRQYYRDPSSVARLITDVALTGKYETSIDKKNIDIANIPNSLIPDGLSRFYRIQNWIDGKPSKFYDGEREDPRSLASQIYDVTAMNLHLLSQGKGLVYRLPSESEILTKEQKDRHRVQGGVMTPQGGFIAWHDTAHKNIRPDSEHVFRLNSLITGKLETGFFIEYGDLAPMEASSSLIREIADFGSLEYPRNNLYAANDLSKILFQIKQANQWPPLAQVDSALPPISQNKGGPHVIVITDVSTDGSKVSYDNTWRKSKDRTGTPSIDTTVLGENIRSPRFHRISFTQLPNNQQYMQDYLQPVNWNSKRAEYQTMSNLLGNDGLDLTQAAHRTIDKNKDVEKWRRINPWDTKLLGFKSTLDFLLAKYPR